MTKTVRRLYSILKPSHYEVRIEPDAKNMTFRGSVRINLKKTGRPSNRLTFHQHDIVIENAKIIKHHKTGPVKIEVIRINNQNTLNEVRLHTKDMIYGGEYQVYMEFHGLITKSMTGLYPSYFDFEDEQHLILATQFESHHAREVFPSIDEPEAKATFKLTLLSPKDQVVLSNTPIETQKKAGDNQTETTFGITPKMSTYLLAFVIGELHSKSTSTNRGTEVSVWATVAQPIDSVDFALETAKRTIEFFEEYFGVNYPLPKADHVALPDFSSGAMENWGLITYRERVLLAYPGDSSQSTMEYIALVVAHETSHQWFGNLVTMKWWDDLWLNESFANVMEYQAVDALFPEWSVWETFVMSEGLSSLRRDASPGVQAVKTVVRHPDEISSIFDPSIVYAKGGRLLYMLKTYLGEDNFRKGLNNYFTEHAYGNTTGDDLWAALKEASGIDIGSFMNPWLERSGFPMVSVDQDKNKLHLKQSHFLENGEKSDGRIWPIPLFADDQSLPERLEKEALSFRLKTAEPVTLNHGSAGHYIVNYLQPEHKAHIVKLVKDKKLNVADRLMLLNSASMISKAGHQSFDEVLKLLEAYKAEQSEAVWGVIALVLAEARRFIDYDETLEPAIKSLIRSMTKHEYARLGWEEIDNEPTSDRKLRATIIGLGVYADEPDITKESLKRFEDYKQNPSSINPELRSIIFGVPIKNKSKGAFGYLLKLHDESANSDLKSDIAAALTITRDTKESEILLGRLKDANLIKPQDLSYWLVYQLRNRYIRDIAWDWMVNNWEWLAKTFSKDMSYDYYPRYASAICNTRVWQDKYISFFKPLENNMALKRNILIGYSEIDTRVKWLERDLASVQSLFQDKKSAVS